MLGCSYDHSSKTFKPLYKADVTTDFTSLKYAGLAAYIDGPGWKVDADASSWSINTEVGATQQ